MNETVIRPIARFESDFPEKFGIPRQAGVVEALRGRVVFEPAWRSDDALRGIEGFSHLWLIWQFSENLREHYAPADLMDGTPIFDVKPYLPYADAHSEAKGGFAPDAGETLRVEIAPASLEKIPPDKREALRGVLENDPRPRYHDDGERVYAMSFAGLTVRFRVSEGTLCVTEVEETT